MADKKITELELATPEETDVIPFVDISDTTMGLTGTTKKATKSDLKGDKGDSATVDVGTTTTGSAGTNASVVNSGTTQNAVFDFTIPRGDKGETGDAGACVESVAFVGDDMVFTLDDASTVTLVGAKTSLKGDTGAQVESVAFVGDDMVFTLDDSSTATLAGAKTALKGDTGDAGDDAYVYIAYASDDTGTGFTTTFNPLLNYIAIKNTTTTIPSPSASDFTGLWKNYKGEKGDTGDIGIDWQGAWSAGTYTITQAVSHNGSSWICTATSTTEEPSISATDWDLIALKGTDGAGSGDVNAPATNTDNYIPQWDGTNSKTLKDGIDPSTLLTTTTGVQKSTYDAHTILYATTDNTPVALTVGEGTVVGRASGGNISALSIDTDLSSVSANDDTIPSAKAVKTYVDNNAGGSSLWTEETDTPTRTANTTFTVTGNKTTLYQKGLIIKWTESSSIKCGMVVSSAYSSVTTVTIIGDTMASIDSNSLKYCLLGVEMFQKNFAVAGNIGAVLTNVANSYYATEPMRVFGADLQVGTAGTTNSTTIDINKGGTTMFTTKPTLATTVAYSPTPFTADSGTSLALGDKVTIDIDAIQTTNAVDLYVNLYVLPTRYLSLE